MKKIKIGDCFVGEYSPVLVVDGDHPFADKCFLLSDLNGHSQYMTEEELRKNQCLPTLHLPIANNAKKYGGCWFDMILSGVKKEEYRQCSVFNRQRLCVSSVWMMVEHSGIDVLSVDEWKPFKVLHLTNGYGHDKPQLWAHIESISIGRGNPEWGAPTDRDVFIIRLGDVFHTKNLKA